VSGAGPAVLALDVGGTHVRCGLVRHGRVVERRSAAWPAPRSAAEELAFVAALARDLAPHAEAAGVSLAALTDEAGVVVEWPNRPHWRGAAVRRRLEDALEAPVVIEDDANAAALGEWASGAGRGHRHGLFVVAGTGIGAGLVLEGRLYRGARGFAGELGHTCVEADGPPCRCGRRGCLQALASGGALDRIAAERGLAGAAALAAAACAGDAAAALAIRSAAVVLGRAVANVVVLLDLEVVVVGGGSSHSGELWWAALREAFASRLPARTTAVLSPAVLGDDACLLGAAHLAQERLSSRRAVAVGLGEPA
jgi:glucokinase